MVTKCKMQNKQTTKGREMAREKKREFLQWIGSTTCVRLGEKRKESAAGSTNGTIIYLSNARTHDTKRLHRSQFGVCMCVCLSVLRSSRGKNGSVTIVAAYGNGLNHSKSVDGCGLPLPFVCRVRSFYFYFFFCFSLSLLFVCKISQIFCRRMNRPMHIFCVRRRRRR